MRLSEILSTDDPLLDFNLRLLLDSFPPEERRDESAWRRLTASEPTFHNTTVIDDAENPVGMLTYWDFPEGAVYIEHFATLPRLRGSGIGSAALRRLIADVGQRPILLEVEMPDDEISRRRIGFYRREGFGLLDIDYIQPPYRRGGTGVEMRLMLRGRLPEGVSAADLATTLAEIVYHRPLRDF